MTDWTDFNDADDQSQSFALIPRGTIVHIRLTIKPGGYDDPSQGWTGGYATRNADTGSVYLNGEFVVLQGEYARRKLWSLIGLSSPKGPEWGQMGRSFIRGILNSAKGIHPDDASPAAQAARRIVSFGELDGIEFLGQVGWEKDGQGQDKAVIKLAVTPDHPAYVPASGNPGRTPSGTPTPAAPAAAPMRRPAAAALPARPAWAQ